MSSSETSTRPRHGATSKTRYKLLFFPRNVGGFVDKVFNGWVKEQKAMLKAPMAEHNGKRWANFPIVPDGQSHVPPPSRILLLRLALDVRASVMAQWFRKAELGDWKIPK